MAEDDWDEARALEILNEDVKEAAGRKAGLMEAANWLRRQASAEKEPKAKAAFTEAHNAILAIAEGRVE